MRCAADFRSAQGRFFLRRATPPILLVLAIAGGFPSAAQQDGEPVSIGNYRVVHSKILNEDRHLLVHLPRGYERSAGAYPVVYMLYGDHVTTYFAEAVAAVDELGPTGQTPEFVLVALANTDRYRDLLPEADGKPTGIDGFIRFWNEELFGFVEKNYRTKPYRILVGPQAGANFGLYAMLKQPQMFQAFIIETPFRWRGGRDLMMGLARSVFQECRPVGRFMHITYREADELEKEGLPYLKEFAKRVQDARCEGFRLELEFLPDSNEFLVPFKIRDGLRELFDGYAFPDDAAVESLDDILAHYRKLSADYGFEVDVPEHVLTVQSDSLMQRGRTDEMLRVLHYMLESNPSSANALWRLGNHHEHLGELEQAVACYERMIAALGSDAGMVRRRVDELERRINEQREE